MKGSNTFQNNCPETIFEKLHERFGTIKRQLFRDLHNDALFPEGSIEVKITKTISVTCKHIC